MCLSFRGIIAFHVPYISSPFLLSAVPWRPSLMASSSSPGRVGEEALHGGDLTPLEKHAAFFDRNNDGIIYPWETFEGFRAIGCGVIQSTAASIFIHTTLSPLTRSGILPSPLLPIYVKNIHKGNHGSDTGTYDTQGRFVPEKFEEIFQKHAHVNPNALTYDELKEMLQANRVIIDYKGWIAAFVEWNILYLLCKDKDGLLQKETIRAVYDGSLFQQLEKERAPYKKA